MCLFYNGEDNEGLKEVSAKALQKINLKQAVLWIGDMKALKLVVVDTLERVKIRLNFDRRQEPKRACPAIENFMELAEVQNLLKSEVFRALDWVLFWPKN